MRCALKHVVILAQIWSFCAGSPYSTVALSSYQLIERKIYALSPKTKTHVARQIATHVVTFCDPRDYDDIILIGFIESGFRENVVSSTQDHGYFQVNEIHGSSDYLTDKACRLLRSAKEQGARCRYHSRTPSLCAAYEKKLKQVERKLCTDSYVAKCPKISNSEPDFPKR